MSDERGRAVRLSCCDIRRADKYPVLGAGHRDAEDCGDVGITMQLERLTRRESDVVRLVALGMTNIEIGIALEISVRTVQTHLSHVHEKWGIESRTEAAMLALGHYVSLEEAQRHILDRTMSVARWN